MDDQTAAWLVGMTVAPTAVRMVVVSVQPMAGATVHRTVDHWAKPSAESRAARSAA
jgi:hypothetical protein